MINLRAEYKILLFYIPYFAITFIQEEIHPTGHCAPGPGLLLFLLSIPVSILLTVILAILYYKTKNKQYLNSIFITGGIWIVVLFILSFYNI
ncbi:hypothetical protein [Flavobacterium branchiicola]|uniref:Uncharacterized protein n=1 Tax=Flavobacterium branchiicola TaxID=1114875 RepID=A0ABV9PI39_9FLAO|nr:hypothetical protein [Flavobacterium branchiicola]MBS7256451.1 hypothetical protein [Flavobacterium branchiicola]